MFQKMIIVFVALVVFTVVPAMADQTGCKKINFTGSYLTPDLNRDVFFDGSVFHSLVFQLTLNSDGTANQYWTGLPDYLINLGTGSPQIGSWTCRNDGKLVVILIQGTYFPVQPGSNPNITTPDVELSRHFRTTYLFSVDDVNTLTKIQSRTRRYTPAEDPTDPAVGTLAATNNTAVVYKRLTATDADLLLP